MSRTLNGTLSTNIIDGCLTLCRCWEIVKVSGGTLRLTDHDTDVEFLGETFASDGGFTISNLESGENLAVDNAEMKALLKTNLVEQGDILSGEFDNATVRVFLVNFTTPANYTQLPGAYLSRMTNGDEDSATFELMSISNRLNQNTGRVVIPTCDADVGDSRCGVNLTAFTVTSTITAVTSQSVFTDSARGEADDFFNYSKLTFTTGNNTGRSYEIKDFASGVFTLQEPTLSPVQVGDGYTTHRGCDRTKATCKDVFSNLDNFRGFPFNIDEIELMSGPT